LPRCAALTALVLITIWACSDDESSIGGGGDLPDAAADSGAVAGAAGQVGGQGGNSAGGSGGVGGVAGNAGVGGNNSAGNAGAAGSAGAGGSNEVIDAAVQDAADADLDAALDTDAGTEELLDGSVADASEAGAVDGGTSWQPGDAGGWCSSLRGTLDQSQLGGGSLVAATPSNPVSQGFVAGRSGQLTSIAVYGCWFGDLTGSAVLTVYSGIDAIGSATLPVADLHGCGQYPWTEFDLTDDCISVDANDVLRFELTTLGTTTGTCPASSCVGGPRDSLSCTTTVDCESQHDVYRSLVNPYASGWLTEGGNDHLTEDLQFQTYVSRPTSWCTPDEVSCDGATLSICNAAGTELYTQDCGDPAQCDLGLSACVQPKGDFTPFTSGNSAWSADFLDLTSIYLIEPITVTKLGLVSGSASNGNVKLALYSDNAGSPDALLIETASASAALLGAVELPVLSQVTLGPGPYWVGSVFDATPAAVAYSDADDPGVRWIAQPFANPFPATLPPTSWDGSNHYNQYLVGYQYHWNTHSGWNCPAGSSCQDVIDVDVPSSARATVLVNALTGLSVPRLALFAPGVALTGTNYANSSSNDRLCVGQDLSDLFGPLLLTPTGTYRVAVGRDSSGSVGDDGTYSLTVFSNRVFFPAEQSVNDQPPGLATTSCP